MRSAFILAVCACALSQGAFGEPIVVRAEPVHLRSGEQREWRSFPERAQGSSIDLPFEAQENAREYSLVLRQRDVKALWSATLNGVELGTLIEDERAMVRVLSVPVRALRGGSNVLRIAAKTARFSDDIEVRDVLLEDTPPSDLQRQATVDVVVKAKGGPMPVRITVVDGGGSLVPVSPLRTGAYEAVRTGVVYSADGRTRVGLPAGEYRIYASRGFEYSAPSVRVKLQRGQRATVELALRHEVQMPGFASCDTHVHTLELSGHGDASVDERVLTAAGEGLDLMVATEHNKLSDYAGAVRKRNLDRWVAAVPGSEVTTAIGHFNIFPVRPGAAYPNYRENDWQRLMESIRRTDGVGVVIQNHPRDLHSNYRPFDPAHHVSPIGENLRGRPFSANAMEVVNSGAMASDPLQLVRDWMGLLTRGADVAAIGASDTHTVDFVPIGQARTYIDVAKVREWRKDVDGVARELAAGRNLVSYGLAVDLREAGPVAGGKAKVDVTVWGPSWAAADEVVVYSNAVAVWQRKLDGNRRAGRKFASRIQVPVPKHDAALVAVVTGPGVQEPFWEVRKSYQPTSIDWTPMVLGVSRAVWIDSDGSGRREAPLEVARRLVDQHGANAATITGYDAAVGEHVRHLLRSRR